MARLKRRAGTLRREVHVASSQARISRWFLLGSLLVLVLASALSLGDKHLQTTVTGPAHNQSAGGIVPDVGAEAKALLQGVEEMRAVRRGLQQRDASDFGDYPDPRNSTGRAEFARRYDTGVPLPSTGGRAAELRKSPSN
jgi:hypothetical protein